MSENYPENPDSSLAHEIAKAFEEIQDLNGQINTLEKKAEPLMKRRRKVIHSLRKKILTLGVPQEASISAYMILSSDMTKPVEQMWEEMNSITEISARIEAARGQAVSWLSVENEVISYKFPGPNDTRNSYYLNIGLLPYDASLEIGLMGAKIPVEKAFRTSIFNNLDDELTWDTEGLGEFNRFFGQTEEVLNPEVFVNGSHALSYTAGKRFEFPLPLVGNKAIEEVFDKHQLEQYPQVAEALNRLTDTLIKDK